MSALKPDNLIMIVCIDAPVPARATLHSHDQPGINQFLNGLNDSFPLHTGLCCNVVVAVPAVAPHRRIAFAEKQIYKHLTGNQHPEHTPLNHEIAGIRRLPCDRITVCAFVAIRFGAALQQQDQTAYSQLRKYFGYCLDGTDSAASSDGRLLNFDVSRAFNGQSVAWQTAQIGVGRQFSGVETEREDLIAQTKQTHGIPLSLTQKPCDRLNAGLLCEIMRLLA